MKLRQQKYTFSLDKRRIEERVEIWRRILVHPKRWAWVAESKEGIVGFSLFGPPRDPDDEIGGKVLNELDYEWFTLDLK